MAAGQERAAVPAGAGAASSVQAFPLAGVWGTAAEPSGLRPALDGAKGRLTVRPSSERHAWLAIPDEAVASLASQATAERGSPWPQPLVSHYARYFRDGNRTDYEGLVAARQQRLTRAVIMAALADGALGDGPEVDAAPDSQPEGSVAWLDEVIDGAYLLCEQSSWSWAAHDDVGDRSGHVVPDRGMPFLDLGAGEVAAQLAWLDLVLGDALDGRAPGLRKRMREEVLERVVQPFLDRMDWHWLGLDGDVHNWNPWIHSNILAAAVILVEEPGLRAATVARCIEGLDRFLASVPADGAIDEGFAYWWNGGGRALEALALLEEATGGALNADIPVIRGLAAFPHRMHLGHHWFLNVADGPARAPRNLPWDMLGRWADRLGDADAARHARAFETTRPDAASGLGRVLHALFRLAADEAAAGKTPAVSPPLTGFTYLDSVQIMVARETPGAPTGLTLAAKGGHNGEHHNHRDVGSVVVAVDGVPLLVDAGQPTYTAETFGPNRYSIRAMQSSWHSVPAPFGLEQGTGAEFAASVLHHPTAEEPRLVLDLAEAYGIGPASNWIRSGALDRPGSRAVIADSWSLADPPASGTPDVVIHYLLAGTVRLGPPGTATVSASGIPDAGSPDPGARRGAKLTWDPASAAVEADEWALDDPLLSDVWGARLTRLRFSMPAQNRAAGAFTLTVEATP
ncbi:heparinase [Arthrobacter sp. NPDC056493]|uniref:heparinase n=1 Tax=Arthrobacter sp. NPDC056493 TaxID=3345839 RepID=UPI00367194FC